MSLPCTFYMICLVAININGQQTNFAGNHKNIFNDARVPWSEYRYYDPKTVGLDFEGMISDIKVCCRSVTLHSKKIRHFVLNHLMAILNCTLLYLSSHFLSFSLLQSALAYSPLSPPPSLWGWAVLRHAIESYTISAWYGNSETEGVIFLS